MVAVASISQQVEGVGRYPEQKRGAGFLQPIDEAEAARQIVHDELAAARQRGDQRTEAEIVRQRAQRVEHCPLQRPVARHHPRVLMRFNDAWSCDNGQSSISEGCVSYCESPG